MFKELKTNGMSGGGEWTSSGTPRPAMKSPRTLVLPEHMDGEQLEEMIAATPLDLSVFSVQTKPIRNAESPLDLSLKTRKRTADSTDENHIQLCVFTGSKRVCQGVAGTPEPLERAFAFRPSLSEYEDTHSGNKGDLYKRQLSTGFDAKPTVIKNGFSLDKGSTPPHNQEHQYHYYQQKQHQQQQQQHQQHLQQLKMRQQDLQSSQQELSPQQLLSQKHQLEQQRQQQLGQQMQLSQQHHQQQKQHHQQQQLLSKQHQLSPQQQLSKHHQLSQQHLSSQQSLSTQQQQVSLQQQLMKQQQLTPQQQLSQHHQQKLKQQQQQQKLQQQQQLHGFENHSQYNKQDHQHKAMSQTTQQEQIHSNTFFQQELKQRQLQRQHHHHHHHHHQHQQHQQQQQRQSRDDVVHERFMQPKLSEKASTALAGYASQRPRKQDIQPGQHVLPGYALCDNTRAANSSQHMDTSKLFYSKQVESRGSISQPFTVKHSAMDAAGFSNELQKTSMQKQTNAKYSTSAGHTGFTGLSVNTTAHSGGTVLAGPISHSAYSSQSGRTNVSGFGPSTSLHQYYNMSGGTMSRRHSPHFEAIQRCSPDSTMSTNSPKQFHSDTETYSDRLKQQRAMLAADQSRRMEQGAGFTSHLTPTSHTFAEPHSPAGNTNGPMYSRESSPGVMSRGSPSAYRGHSPSALRQHSAQSRGSSPSGGRNVLPYLSHSLSPLVHSAMSPVVPMSRATERSIIKGTSGVCKAPPSDNQGIHSNTNVCDSKISVQHSVLKHSSVQRTVPDRVPSDGAATKPSETMDQIVRIKEEEPFSVPKHLPTYRSVLNNEKTLQTDIKTEKDDKCQTVAGNADDVRKAEEPEIEKYTYPLTIAIPGSTAATSTNQSSQSTAKESKPSETVVVKAPRPYSKKQIIMNAVNNDECLKKIVNTVTPPRPKPASYVTSDPHHLNQNCFQNSSPTFPESPKMPTLSPQQKLSPAMVSPLIGEPPTLDPPDVSSQRLRLDSKISVVRKFSLGGLSDKSESRLEDTSGFVDGDSRSCRGDHSLMGGNSFSKWNSGYIKNIPVANVSPMVHGHSTTASKTKAEVTRPESCEDCKGDIDPNKPVDQKPSSISVSETFGEIKFDERFIDDDLLVLDKNDVSSFSRSRNVMKSLNRQKQLSNERTDERNTVISDCPVQSDMDEEDSIHERKYYTSRSQSADKSRSSSADKSRSSSADKTRSMLAEIANSEGYVGESKVKVKTDDLLTDDPATLGREQRALLRAIKRFEEMEEKIDQPPSSPKSAKQSNTKLKADEIRRKARGTKQRMSRTDRLLGRQKWIGRRKRKKKIAKPKGFIDFKPKVLEPRTRTQAAGKKPTYDRNAAYDRELSREECRKALKRRERLRQTARRICRRMSEKQEKLAQERRLSTEENKDSSESGKVGGENGNKESETDHSGMWEIGDTSSALRQTLRSGKSKGGLMMTLLFKPKHLRFGRRHSPRRGGYQLRTTTLRDANGARSKRLELGNKLEGARRRGQAARRKLNDQRRQHSTEQQEQHRHLVAIGNVNDSADGPLPFVDGPLEASSFDTKTESSNDGSYPLPPEVKKLAVCRDTGETILHRAARMGHTEIALHCVQSGRVDVNVRDNAGYTPLHESCVSGHRGIAHLLLSRGASVNCSSQDGIRPIHDAVENDNVELVRMLLSFGADPTLSTYGGKTPLKIARSDRMKQLLEGHLGDLNGFASDQDRTVWPCVAFGADKTFLGMGIFNDIPADPAEEDESDYIMESRDPEFTCFKLAKTDNKNTSGNHVLLNDVTDFLQIRLDDVLSDSSVKSMVTNVSKTKLAATSYGQTHPERVSRIPGTSGKAVLSRELKEVFEICSKQKAAAKSALAQSNFPHKFKHYKLQKGYDSQFDTPSTSAHARETSRFQQVGMTKCNFEETSSKNSMASPRGCKLDMRTSTATASSDCTSVSDSVYDFDDVTDDFADVADNFSMRIGAVPEDFRVFNGHPNVTSNCKQDFDSNL